MTGRNRLASACREISRCRVVSLRLGLLLGRLVACLVAWLAVPTGAAAGQYAFNNTSYAYARNTSPPAAWRVQPLNIDATLAMAWFGNSATELADLTRPRTLLTAWDPATGTVYLELGYRPSTGELVGGARDTTGVWRPMTTIGSAGTIADGAHHALAAVLDTDAGPGGSARLAISLLSQGTDGIAGAFRVDGLVGGLAALPLTARITVGDPRAAGAPASFASHSDPLFAVLARRGAMSTGEIAAAWDRPGGPRFRDFLGSGQQIEDEMLFAYGQSADLEYQRPGDTQQVYAWFDGDLKGWSRWLAPSNALLIAPASSPQFDDLQITPMHEPGFAWSGFWQFSPPDPLIELDPVPGRLPEFYGVLTGTRAGSTPLMAWGLGNSRWANTTSVPASIGSSVLLSRSHIYGLRAARPEYDGGFFVLDLNARNNIDDLTVAGSGNLESIVPDNWSRFSYGGSQAALPGNGRASHIVATPGAAATPRFRVTRPSETSESLAVLLLRPNGGRVRTSLEVATAGGAAIAVPGAPTLFGLPDEIETNTARQPAGVAVLGASAVTLRVPDTTLAQVGDAVVIQGTDAVNVISAIESASPGELLLTFEHEWVAGELPTSGGVAFVGPWTYLMVGHAYETPDASRPIRGVRLEHVSGGRVTVLGAGYRERAGRRIAYILAGRGGEGQSEQAEREFAGALRRMSDAMGVGLFFAGNATQSDMTLEALQAQLTDRIESAEFVGTPDVVSGPGNTFFVQDFLETHEENRAGALQYEKWAYLQIQDDFPGMFDQAMALWRQDSNHPNGRGMFEAAERWWTAIEASLGTVILPEACPADVNGDGVVSPSDFGAWVAAYNALDPSADQNGDGQVDPADFGAWVANYNAGCD